MPTRRRDLTKIVSVLLLCFMMFASGCKKMALYHNLNEEQANEIIVVLFENKIEADKEKEVIQNDTFWTVSVNEKDLPEARRLLLERQLPRVNEPGLSDIYKEKGLIPTPDEQKARFIMAMKGEIINSLEKLPEVIDADVVLNTPTPEEFATDGTKRPAASIIIKLKPVEGVTSDITEAKIQKYVANSIENLNPRDVTVIMSYIAVPDAGKTGESGLYLPGRETRTIEGVPITDTVKILGIAVDAKSAAKLKIYMFIFFALMLVMSAILIINFIRSSRLKNEYLALAEGTDRPLIEGEVEGEERGETNE